jgi:hypothetical protein
MRTTCHFSKGKGENDERQKLKMNWLKALEENQPAWLDTLKEANLK